ncbi:MAG: hypothetical protein M0P05_01720 [Candidatus Colwellbacteria bacterium]|nr:hypothetical protein [Candidatus Colwellbacteria bacterium]
MSIIKRYLPDILILSGILVYLLNSYWGCLERKYGICYKEGLSSTEQIKVLSIIMVAIGIDIAIRKIISIKNKDGINKRS